MTGFDVGIMFIVLVLAVAWPILLLALRVNEANASIQLLCRSAEKRNELFVQSVELQHKQYLISVESSTMAKVMMDTTQNHMREMREELKDL